MKLKKKNIWLTEGQSSRAGWLPDWIFQRYWSTISGDLHRCITAFYLNKLNLWRLNKAYISLIPKKIESSTVSDYRSISVLSAIPKIITKILASRLQPYVPDLIHVNQTSFVKDRQLMQTFISTREILVHLAKHKIPSIFIKVDFQKAFDSISWDFLIEVLRARGFPPL
jgi:Reverse transcriptase (RNA-dependent DNA polymerase)